MRIGGDVQCLTELRRKTDLMGNAAILTEHERAHCAAKSDPWSSLGGILSAKEACIKALDALEGLPRFGFRDLEIRHTPSGRPVVHPAGELGAFLARERKEVDVTISHSGEYVFAMAVVFDGERR